MQNVKDHFRVVAIAKDEGPYIPEWVHHHLYFGFDSLEILINRTTDNSTKILDLVASEHPCVKYRSCDWIDLLPNDARQKFQYIAYAEAYQRALDEGVKHVLFLDIDEFWTPQDFVTDIKEFTARLPADATVSFNWMCELGTDRPFEVFERELLCFPNDHLKTLVNCSSTLSQIKIHVPILTSGIHLLADGTRFQPREGNDQFHADQDHVPTDAFVIHRMYRSEVEYLSALYRGNPNSRDMVSETFKNNRFGFRRTSGSQRTIKFEESSYDKYLASLWVFLDRCRVHTELESARDHALNRYTAALRAAPKFSSQCPDVAKKIFSGCQDENLHRILATSRGERPHCLDTVAPTDQGVEITGWVVRNTQESELNFVIEPNEDWDAEVNPVLRPDIVRAYPGSAQDCGFRLRLSNGSTPSQQMIDTLSAVQITAVIGDSRIKLDILKSLRG